MYLTDGRAFRHSAGTFLVIKVWLTDGDRSKVWLCKNGLKT